MHLLILAQDEAAGGNPFATFLPLILIAVFVYFVMIRPQRKRQQEFKAMQSDLSVGDTVYTIGGLMGVVDEIHEGTVDLVVTNDDDGGIVLRFKRSAIAEIQRDGAGDDAEETVDVEVEDEATP